MPAKRLTCFPSLLLFLFAFSAVAPHADAQQTETQTELQELKSDLKRIEARIDALEQQQATTPAAALSPESPYPAPEPAPTNTPPGTPTVAAASIEKKPMQDGPEVVKQAEDKGMAMDTMDAGMGGETIALPYIPSMKFRGFGDFRGFLANQNLAVIGSNVGSPTPATQGGNSTFALGLLDLFVTSQISEHFSYLAELGFEANPTDNNIGVDTERAQLSWVPSDKFALTMGRSHAMLGTTTRPSIMGPGSRRRSTARGSSSLRTRAARCRSTMSGLARWARFRAGSWVCTGWQRSATANRPTRLRRA